MNKIAYIFITFNILSIASYIRLIFITDTYLDLIHIFVSVFHSAVFLFICGLLYFIIDRIDVILDNHELITSMMTNVTKLIIYNCPNILFDNDVMTAIVKKYNQNIFIEKYNECLNSLLKVTIVDAKTWKKSLNYNLENDMCAVCHDKHNDTILFPCKHSNICIECAKNIMKSTKPNCPLCRENINCLYTYN